MKAIMIMFDSLNRHMLAPYGDNRTVGDNFSRIAGKGVTFDNCYAGSLPCMPARRELHTGRYNFLHRSWGPIEPFDVSTPELLKFNGVYSHLISDHPHYWEDGGSTYHSRYSSWECVRGQEGDPWKASVNGSNVPETINRWNRQDWVNRGYMQDEKEMCLPRTFALAEQFLEANHNADNWFLQIETFDPHEPFYASERFRSMYPDSYQGPLFDWPEYRRVTETEEQQEHCRNAYRAVVSMCDHYLGRLMDLLDARRLWDDTLVIVNTDHGFLLGEHGWWAKAVQPFYDEVARIPLFVWDPRTGVSGERFGGITQTIDLAPTILDYFNVLIPASMRGMPLNRSMDLDGGRSRPVLFGMHGGHLNCCDGRYIYMKAPDLSKPLYNYTLMPTHMRGFYSAEELSSAELTGELKWAGGHRVIRTLAPTGAAGGEPISEMEDLLFDVIRDPRQEHPLRDPALESMMREKMSALLVENDAPDELHARFGLEPARILM